jgi:RHS repeat-associated protein
MGTPEAMYREDGEAVWTCELNSYGKVRDYKGESKTMCPFRYQGQYEDAETGLYYNRFRYYSPEEGMYLSQYPIGLNGGIHLYSYVYDTNGWVDELGLRIASPSQTVGSTTSTTVYGKGQVTGIGHSPAMENAAIQMRDSGAFRDIYRIRKTENSKSMSVINMLF